MAGTKRKKKATTEKQVTLSEKLYRDISRYCQMNNIEDVDGFIVNCLMQGYNVVKFGYTPKDNIRREYLGIKEPDVEEKKDEAPVATEKKEEQNTTKRKIRIIKKD